MLKKKSLGQHFLRNPYYLSLIAESAQISSDDTVIEIGPGDGALTEALLARGARVVAIEKDRRLIPLLTEKFAGKNFELIEADALTFDISKVLKKSHTYKLVGNIPYYITGALFKKFLTSAHQPSTLVFLIQKEVATRIARDKKESLLSLSIKAYGEPRYVQTISRGNFAPPPKVDSAILVVENISRKNFMNAAHEKKFFQFIRAGFAHKRKLLANNLRPMLGGDYSSILQKTAIDPGTRAEDMELIKWLRLSRP